MTICLIFICFILKVGKRLWGRRSTLGTIRETSDVASLRLTRSGPELPCLCDTCIMTPTYIHGYPWMFICWTKCYGEIT
ncbi:hypothetical protein P170DRAFT_260638 [Aspergillus steynii IBT 23096]|uniref:Secreted protein n=1 Tax=Aspergillus steynii IBT 23096 TaxID=1392250 RepID=A0A2I2FZQ4_9EURO|nr:uncharacterized protein P170DRAFT_260638 [Aspergillus steynii IBT 23096]PLB46108.1 hypothetical protein P170DRAFT_260638 [Aspergillus steynii IBT 23096]